MHSAGLLTCRYSTPFTEMVKSSTLPSRPMMASRELWPRQREGQPAPKTTAFNHGDLTIANPFPGESMCPRGPQEEQTGSGRHLQGQSQVRSSKALAPLGNLSLLAVGGGRVATSDKKLATTHRAFKAGSLSFPINSHLFHTCQHPCAWALCQRTGTGQELPLGTRWGSGALSSTFPEESSRVQGGSDRERPLGRALVPPPFP